MEPILLGPSSDPGGDGPGGIGFGPTPSGGGPNVPPSPPPPPVRTGRKAPLIRRDPTVDRREGRNWEILSAVINSLMIGGYIYKTGSNTYALQITGTNNGPTGTFTDTF